MSSTHTMLSAVMGLSYLASLAGEVLLVATVATVVRRHRPDAWGGLLVWAICSLVASLLTRIAWTVGLAFAGRDGVDAVVTFQTVLTVVSTVVTVVLFLLLARGLVMLAQPPKPVVVPGDGAYR